MADNEAAELGGCNEEVPLLGVTREFDFGQFIELFDETPDRNAPNLPTLSRVVIQPNATLAADRDIAPGRPPSEAVGSVSQPAAAAHAPAVPGFGARASSIAPAPAVPAAEPAATEVDLFALTEQGPSAKRPPVPAEIKDVAAFLKKGMVEVAGENYKVEMPEGMRAGLEKGLAYTVLGTPEKGEGRVPLRVYPSYKPVKLNKAMLAQALAGNLLENGFRPVLTAGAMRALLSGTPVLTHGVGGEGKSAPLALIPPEAPQEPRGNSFQVFDLPSFLANPVLPSKSGALLPVDLNAPEVEKLISGAKTGLTVGGKPVELTVIADPDAPEFKEYLSLQEHLRDRGLPALKPSGEPWKTTLRYPPVAPRNPHFVHPYQPEKDTGPGVQHGVTVVGGSGGPQPATVAAHTMTDKVQPRLPTGTGLPVAVFVPWRQTWTLQGFSRGNLLSSIALAPGEQLTMQVSSWERRTRTLEQSSETDVDQQTDVSQSTRDTEDVFKEMLAKRDFAWQLSGSIDASYSPGVASIRVHAGGAVSQTDSIQQTARNSSQSLRESTIKASSRVRSRRVTRVTQTVESGKEERVTRLIRNPNQCRTLTMDFFETLAHYEIKLQFLRERLRLVVLVPNPVRVAVFDSATVRRNETALRNALIETALEDGFEACRLAAAYEEAKTLVSLQKSEAAKAEEIEAQRSQPPPADSAPAADPQEAEVLRVVGEMVNALKRIRLDAGIDEALTEIRYHRPVSETLRRKAQQWLFINFCASKLPALLSTLDDIAGGAAVGIAAAQRILSVLPRPDAPVNLGNLNQMSDTDKENACLASKLKEADYRGMRRFMQMDWDWGWWTERLRQEGLYSANDGGLGGGADQLLKAYQSWEAKKAQGDAMKDQDVAKAEAEGKQEKATTDDKLSMAFPLEDLARAYERMKVLFAHLNEHKDFYDYALFQALPPTEQVLKIVEAGDGRLKVGLFEPRVVAMSGNRLVVPLTPLAGSPELRNFVASLGDQLDASFAQALLAPDKTVLPTPGVSVSSRLGKCTGCEDFIEDSRKHELARLEALAQQEQAEADRRKARLAGKDLGEFLAAPAAMRLELANKTPGAQ